MRAVVAQFHHELGLAGFEHWATPLVVDAGFNLGQVVVQSEEARIRTCR
jgi:hypothetical protein